MPDDTDGSRSTPRHRAGIVCLNGYRLDEGPGSDLYRLYHHLCGIYHDRRRSAVLHRTWDANHEATADLLVSHRPDILAAVAYSYGAGWGLTRLAKALQQRGRRIDVVYLIDPVTRYRVQKWRSLMRGQVYKVPPNIGRVMSWRQVNKKSRTEPVGQEPVAASDRTAIDRSLVMGSPAKLNRYATEVPPAQRREDYHVDHYTIDGLPEVWEAITRDLTATACPLECQL